MKNKILQAGWQSIANMIYIGYQMEQVGLYHLFSKLYVFLFYKNINIVLRNNNNIYIYVCLCLHKCENPAFTVFSFIQAGMMAVQSQT